MPQRPHRPHGPKNTMPQIEKFGRCAEYVRASAWDVYVIWMHEARKP